MGHLHKGGMWFKKKSVLLAEHHYDTEKSAGSTDLRTTWRSYANYSSSIYNYGLPSAADAGNYFYLPALGQYDSGQLFNVGLIGGYWSSSATPHNSILAYILGFNTGGVFVLGYARYNGYWVGGFE